MVVNIISLPHRKDRRENAIEQSKEQGFDIKFHDGVVVEQMPFVGVSRAHKRVVMSAKMRGLPECYIGEDDLKFPCKGSWEYYVNNKPKEFDLYLAGVYNYEGQGGTLDENNRVKDFFCGLTLYCIPQHYYDQFLKTREMNHLDRELSKRCQIDNIIVCNPMAVYQINGWSDLKKKDCDYTDYLKGRPMFNG